MKPKLYLETTIPSYLTSWSSRDLIIAGHQQITREWWEKRRGDFDIYISQFVLDEVSAGDPFAAHQRIKAVKGLALLDITPEVGPLARSILDLGLIPPRSATDAAHIAIAAVHGIQFLMTWNCVHLANAVIAQKVAGICVRNGFACPTICTPEALLGE